MKIAIFQMDLAFGDPEKNYEKVKSWISRMHTADLIILPELWTTGYDLPNLKNMQDHYNETVTFLRELAVQYNVNIIGGSAANLKDGNIFNTMPVIDRKGSLIHEYSKLHLFKLMDEHLYLKEGADDASFKLEQIHFAGFICYDIRFPEWIRKSVLSGAKVVVIPAEWPAARIDHWTTLLKARAIENQVYVIACNRVGSDHANEFGGHSIMIDPWGKVIAEGSDREEIVYGDIYEEEVEEIRKRIPIFDDRRADFY
ncbi:carbon-nitrogen family hydrolase [Jeotgalibacillus salarius]|uniref:Carbon-nitrogen family hydrolase n=1 Tax=Jeotgalibacillus salarius TaxID=546023 RepID=A0A4Y8LFL0_9BACL|nr:carbon-nitrogen family hydrolase [Jeotgalibacillus salarius]TFE00343.1 carbon-nitrogen family hydrolase [Jeotgalibacillus salarius]